MNYYIVIIMGLCSVCFLPGQNKSAAGLPYLRDRDSRVLERQANHILDLMTPLAAEHEQSVVSVEYRGVRLALGTVTSVGVVSKWSEVQYFVKALTFRLPSGERVRTEPLAVLEEYDLVILSMPAGLDPVSFGVEPSKLGEFLFVAGPGGQAYSRGVVSVASRSLRESDKGYLGVRMDRRYNEEGILIKRVEDGSGAKRAGLLAGDVIQDINGEKLAGSLEMANILQRMEAGSRISVGLSRNGERKLIDVVLSGRPELGDSAEGQIRDLTEGRIARMRKMGTQLSQVRTNFPSAIQSDMPIEPEDCGGPVFNLNSEFVGIAIARASRTKSYIIPANELKRLLEPKEEAAPKALLEPLRALPVQPDRSAELRSEIEAKRRELRQLEGELRKLELE